MDTFWVGFEKRAASLYGAVKGIKALNRGNSTGSMMARPTSMMATASRTSPGALPSATVPKSMPQVSLPKQPASTRLSPTSKSTVQKIDAQPAVAI